MVLFCKDVPVLSFIDDKIIIHKPELLPLEITDESQNIDIYEYIRHRPCHILSEQNKQLLSNKYPEDFAKSGFQQSIFLATSMTDSYWIQPDNSNLTWENINPRENRLCDICILKEIEGFELYPQTDLQYTPDFKNGASPKIWKESISDPHTEKYLYKQNDDKSIDNEAKIECTVSNILDRTNVSHVHYEMVDERICKCKNIANDELSIISAAELHSFCNYIQEDMQQIIKETDYANYCKMRIVDYLIDNPDRTENNYGFYRDNHTGDIIGLHPLFDHNNSFGNYDKQRPKILQSELYQWLEYSNIKFNSVPTLKDFFYDQDKYNTFTDRACELGIFEKIKDKQNIFQKVTKQEPKEIIKVSEKYFSKNLEYDKAIPFEIYEKPDKDWIKDELNRIGYKERSLEKEQNIEKEMEIDR